MSSPKKHSSFLKSELQQQINELKQRLAEAETALENQTNPFLTMSQDLYNIGLFPAENPNPVLRISEDGRLLYANPASQPLLDIWGCRLSGLVPDILQRAVKEVQADQSSREVVIEALAKTYSFTCTPILTHGYVNLYGKEITELMKAKHELQLANVELERRVEERTQELSKANGELQSALEELRVAEEQLHVQNDELVEINKKLSESETRLTHTLSRVPVVMWVMDRQGTITFAAGRDFNKLRLEPKELPGRSVYEWTQNRPELAEFLRRALEGEEVTETLASQITPGYYYEAHYLPYRDERGEINGVLCVAANISERVQAEAELRETHELLETVFASVDIMIAYMDRGFNFIRVNRAYAQADGHEPEYFTGKNHFELFPNEENKAIFQRVAETGEPYVVFEKPFVYEYNRERGVTYWDWNLQPVKDARQQVQGVVLSLVDVTQRVRADQQYHKGLEQGAVLAGFSHALTQVGPDYQAVLDTVTQRAAELLNCNCAIRLISDDGKALELAALQIGEPTTELNLPQKITAYSQPAGEGIAGQAYQKAEGMLLPKIDLELAETQYSPAYVEYLKELHLSTAIALPLRLHGEALGVMLLFRCIEGNPFTREDLERIQPMADRAALAINNARLYRDLQKALQQEQRMRIQLIQAEKYAALARLVASVAHELNNPIQTIQNCMYLLNNELEGKPDSQKFMEMAVSEAKRVARLVDQLKETYRPAKSTQAQVFNVIETIQRVSNILEPHLSQNRVSLRITSQQEVIRVNGIVDQIKQVFLNISLNAIEAMQPKGGFISVEVSLTENIRQGAKMAAIAFHNTGPCIPEENLSKLFEPFFTTKPRGTGLGLTICYEIIQSHGGEITVESIPEDGTTFTVWLPVYGGE